MARYATYDEDLALWTYVDQSVLTATATSIDFSSIDTSFTMLRLLGRLRIQGTITVDLTLNADTGSNYHDANVRSGTSAALNSQAHWEVVSHSNTGNNEAVFLDILIAKPESDLEAVASWTCIINANASVEEVTNGGGQWANTADLIDQVTLTASTADALKAGSRLTLLGSKIL